MSFMKTIRILDLVLQLLVLAAGILAAWIKDAATGLLVYSLAIAAVQSVSHLYFYLRESDKRRLTAGRRIFQGLYISILLLAALAFAGMLLNASPFSGLAGVEYLLPIAVIGLGIAGPAASFYYMGLTVYELRMYLYLQAQAEAVDFGA